MWKAKFQFKDLLVDGEVVPEKAQEIGVEIVTRLRATHAFSGPAKRTLIELFEDVPDQDELNGALQELYDTADAERVWLGFRQ